MQDVLSQSAIKSKPTVFILHNTPAPYRLPLFQELTKHADIEVYFCKPRQKSRLWQTSLETAGFRWKVAKSLALGPFLLNTIFLEKGCRCMPDAYLVGENSYETLFPILCLLLASKLKGTPLIVWSGVFLDEWAQQKRRGSRRFGRVLLRLYRQVLYRNANAFVAYSEKARNYLLERGVQVDKVFVGGQTVPDGSLEVAPPVKEKTDQKERLVVLSVSYLTKRKGIDILVRAFKELNMPSVFLAIAGSGEEEANLRALAANDDRIHFLGHVDGPEKAKWYSLADIFVLPTLHDPWGLVVNEAMHYGLPVITTEAAGCSQMIGENGIVIPPGDKEALKEALIRLLEDNALRANMGLRSGEYLKKHTLSSGVKPFVHAIHKAIRP